MKEMKKESKAMNEWMDETEKLVGSLRIDMDPKKASRVRSQHALYNSNTRALSLYLHDGDQPKAIN